MSIRTEEEWAAWQIERATKSGSDWFEKAVNGVERQVEELKRYAERYAEMKTLKETYQIERLRPVDDVDGLSREWLEEWAAAAHENDAVISFEALYDLERQDILLLDVRDTL